MALGCEQANIYRLIILRESLLFTIISKNLIKNSTNAVAYIEFLDKLFDKLSLFHALWDDILG